MELLQVGKYFGGVLGHIGDDVDLADHAFVVDQERVPPGELRIVLGGWTHDVVGGTDQTVDIAQQGVPEALGLGELEVLGRCIERRPEDDAIGLGESCGAVTQRLSFDCSTGRGRLGIPPQQHPVTTELGKAHLVAVLVGQAEVGSGGSGSDHLARLGAVG